MKEIKTEILLIPYKSGESLEQIFNKANQMLIRNKKKLLRIVLLEISNAKAKLLVSLIYETR